VGLSVLEPPDEDTDPEDANVQAPPGLHRQEPLQERTTHSLSLSYVF